jgi:hypothetical protein
MHLHCVVMMHGALSEQFVIYNTSHKSLLRQGSASNPDYCQLQSASWVGKLRQAGNLLLSVTQKQSEIQLGPAGQSPLHC